ncbi:hypothetical protein RND81_11G219500 [Saponaria officinalis]|uniref:TF-B3 domain-containing protein n=1 Tax=Saponaria officinalis TaxID=3572 RepID=A0AAW1HQE0_SAPOF
MSYIVRYKLTRGSFEPQKIPTPFCRRSLPAVDTLMTLETETGELYETKYLPRQRAFSGGWGRFAVCEKLSLGDLAVFRLVGATRLKVYIIRKGSSVVKLPTNLLNLFKETREAGLDVNELIVYKRGRGNENCKNPDEAGINFNNITGFNDFRTIINDLLQNHDLSEVRLRTYELCRSQNVILHEHLLKGLNSKFLVEAIRSTISTTVNISISLRTCTLSTFLDNVSQWSTTLKCYKALGMNVGFLSSRLHHLQTLAVSSEGAVSRQRYIDACRERLCCECEFTKLKTIHAKWRKVLVMLSSKVKALESKGGWEEYMEVYFRLRQAKDEIKEIEVLIAELCRFFEHYDDVIETLKLKANNHELEFQAKVDTPW